MPTPPWGSWSAITTPAAEGSFDGARSDGVCGYVDGELTRGVRCGGCRAREPTAVRQRHSASVGRIVPLHGASNGLRFINPDGGRTDDEGVGGCCDGYSITDGSAPEGGTDGRRACGNTCDGDGHEAGRIRGCGFCAAGNVAVMREGDGSLIRFPVSLDREADGLRFVFLHRVVFSFNAVGCRSYSDGQRDGLSINDQLQGLLPGSIESGRVCGLAVGEGNGLASKGSGTGVGYAIPFRSNRKGALFVLRERPGRSCRVCRLCDGVGLIQNGGTIYFYNEGIISRSIMGAEGDVCYPVGVQSVFHPINADFFPGMRRPLS